MKDYYYFLGIGKDSSNEDIKKVYRKLSLKYHPDKNPNDDFFKNRFREVQEAYETLIDIEKRKVYDTNLQGFQSTQKSYLPPQIKSFTADKIYAKKGEQIIIKWQTVNADVVKVIPFGLEKAYGERVFEITEFTDGKFQLLLHSHNSLLRKTAVQGITITEVFENNQRESPSKSSDCISSNENQIYEENISYKYRLLIVFFILIMILICYLFL